MLFPHPAGDATYVHINFLRQIIQIIIFTIFSIESRLLPHINANSLIPLAAYDVSLKRDIGHFILQTEVRL